MTHDSFAVSKEVKADFERESGLTLRILQGGDAGEALNRALLTAGNPQGDVLFGVDDNLLSRALDGDLFDDVPVGAARRRRRRVRAARRARHTDRPRRGLPQRRPGLVRRARHHAAGNARAADPAALPGAARGRERGHLEPRSRVPARDGGAVRRSVAGLLAQAAGQRRQGRRRLGGGVHAAVLRCRRKPRYAADRRLLRHEPRRGGDLRGQAARLVADCRRRGRVLPAGRVRRRAARCEERAGARQLLDFMLSERFQADVPGSMFVYPVRDGVPLPEAFTKHAIQPAAPLSLEPGEIEAGRDAWIDQWTQIVLR